MQHESPDAPTRLSRVGVIDVGSNSVLLLVLDRAKGQILDDQQITRVGEGVFERGELDPVAAARTRSCVEAFARAAREAGAERVVAAGTEALRRARDGRAFMAELEAEGVLDRARVLPGDVEAELSLAAFAGSGRALVIDVGGGSTEVAWPTGGPPAARGPGLAAGAVSLPCGSVRLCERHAARPPLSSEKVAALRADARNVLAPALGGVVARAGGLAGDGSESGPLRVVAVAGTATTLAAMELELEPYDPARVEGLALERRDVARWIERLAAYPRERLLRVPGLEAGRADVIVGGLVALEQALLALGVETFEVSARGLRHALAERLLDRPNSF